MFEGQAKKQAVTAFIPPLCLLALWAAMLLIAHPIGSFPMNDDWNYARSVQELVQHHHLLITQWSLAASLTHILIGALFCLFGGFSFETLRVCGVAMGVACSLITYAIARNAGVGRFLSVVSAALLITNPLFFDLANTFMTDVPFLTLAAAAIHQLLQFDRVAMSEYRQTPGAKTRLIIHLSAAKVLCVALCLSRQTGIVIPLAYLLMVCMRNGTQKTPRWYAAVPLVSSTIAIVLFQWWLKTHVGTLFSYLAEEARLRALMQTGPLAVTIEIVKNMLRSSLYLGLFFVPLLAFVFPRFLTRLAKEEKFLAVALTLEIGVLVGGGLLFTGSVMPLADNVLFSGGLGPILLRSATNVVPWPAPPMWIWMALTVLSAFGAGMLTAIYVVLLMRMRKRGRLFETEVERRTAVFSLAITTLYVAVILFRGFFDRYLIFPMLTLTPFILLVGNVVSASTAPETAEWSSRKKLWAGVSVCLLLGVAAFSSVAVHDLFSWNRARWAALNRLTASGISPMDIDGGLEFNGWYGYDPRYIDKGVVLRTDMGHNDLYVVSLQPLKGFNVQSRVPFDRWLPSGKGEILILRRNG